MRLTLHIGPDAWTAERIQRALAANRSTLASRGVLYPTSPGRINHTRAFMAISLTPDVLSHHRGYNTQDDRNTLRHKLSAQLDNEVAATQPNHVILAAHQWGSRLTDPRSLAALKEMLAPLITRTKDGPEIIAHLDTPSAMLARRYAEQVLDGRSRSIELERRLLSKPKSWWQAAQDTTPPSDPAAGLFHDVQAAPAFLDLTAWHALWADAFGPGKITLRYSDPAQLNGATLAKELNSCFGVNVRCDQIAEGTPPPQPSAEWLARARAFNDLLLRYMANRDFALPRKVWRQELKSLRVAGPAIASADLRALDAHFQKDIRALAQEHPTLIELLHVMPRTSSEWHSEPPFTEGFRASQVLLSRLPELGKHRSIPVRKAKRQLVDQPAPPHLPVEAQTAYRSLIRSPFAPHNRLGAVDETQVSTPYPIVHTQPKPGTSSKVIVACMKDEAPYILEWIAYHRTIGVDHFLIYTNDCSDGTVEMLARLAELGGVTHRDNSDWRGNSPQQHALNRALSEPVIQTADWIAHIDVDEFINVRCGTGTLDDAIARLPSETTNIAMTWRLFGHNDVKALSDAPVIAQFDHCAPSFCPKPHIAWGFKTLFRNIGAYEKLSCHRPNKLREHRATDVLWVNGAGKPIGEEIKTRGWRSTKRSIGYDLIQLNHYALRSAESFLIKRQRGRALHVDRKIGLNYWVRMDWSHVRDVTIQRNLPRLKAARAALLDDPVLRHWHESGLAWHRAKAAELRAEPEFAALFNTSQKLKLTATERAAYALSMDMET